MSEPPAAVVGSGSVPRSTLALSCLAQTTQGFATLSFILVGHAAGFRLGVGSAAIAAFAAGAGIARPVQARGIDRLGSARVLLYCGVAHELALMAVAASGACRSAVGLVVAGLLTGLSLPPISTWQRVDWPRRFATPARAFSLVALLQITAVLIGPLMYGALAAVTRSQGGATVFAGTVASVCTAAIAVREWHGSPARVAGARPLWRRHVAPLLWSAVGGTTAGAISVIAPASAIAAGHASLGWLMVAAETTGGVAGGLIAGRFGARLSPTGLLAAGGCVQIIGALALVMGPSLGLAALALAVEGLGLVPTIAAVSAMTAQRSGGSAEFFGWQSTAQSVGIAGGSALAGAVAEVSSLGGLRASAAVPLVCAVVMVVTASRSGDDASPEATRT